MWDFLGNQQKAIKEPNHAEIIYKSNFSAIVPIIDFFANQFEKKKDGFIIGISSVAGIRAKKVIIFMDLPKQLLLPIYRFKKSFYESNVHIMTVLPGYVETKMTKIWIYQNG